MYAYWVCAAQETPIFSPKFPFRSISFSQMTQKIRSGASPFYIFCRSRDHHFTISLISTRSPPPTASSARTQSIRQRPGLVAGQSASQTRPGSSGDPHLHAQIGSSSVRSPTVWVSRSKQLKLVPEPRIFTLDRGACSGAWADFSLCRGTYLPKFGVSTPPPPPLWDQGIIITIIYLTRSSIFRRHKKLCFGSVR